MKAKSALSLAVIAGVAASATAGSTPANKDLRPVHKAGVMYVNMVTGERSITLYEQGEIPEVDPTNGVSTLFDYWVALDENPCWDSPLADGFGFGADTTTDITNGAVEPIIGFDFGDLPFDSKITGITLNGASFIPEDEDSNNDGVLDSGLDTVGVFFDALSEGNRVSMAPPTAAVRIESIPGNLLALPTVISDYDLIVDFGTDINPTNFFELGDSDGANLGDLWLSGAASGLDYSATLPTSVVPTPDGLADFQYLQYYQVHGSNAKVTEATTLIGVGTPEGTITVVTFQTTTLGICTTTTTSGSVITSTCVITVTSSSNVHVADALPAGQSAFRGFGLGMLGAGADASNFSIIPGFPAGCCYSFGAIDCEGFLDQLVIAPDFNDTWYNFTPLSQIGLALLSDTDSSNPCDAIDFLPDGFYDNGDIGAFVAAFLGGDLAADINGDGFLDNGDIGLFVQIFLSCAG